MKVVFEELHLKLLVKKKRMWVKNNRIFWQLPKMNAFKVEVEKEMNRFERHHQEKISQENQVYKL